MDKKEKNKIESTTSAKLETKDLNTNFSNPNPPLDPKQSKKLQRKQLVVIIILGVITVLIIVAMILVLVLVKK